MDNGEIYRDFLGGDRESMRALIYEYRDGLLVFINSLVGNMREAEELTEDVFVSLVVDRPHFAGGSSFKTWLYAIGRNITANYLRKRRRSRELSQEAMDRAAAPSTPESTVIGNDQQRILYEALGTLRPHYKQVLYLTYFENFSNAETAEIMGRTKRQIETLLYSARKALKDELERRGFIYEDL